MVVAIELLIIVLRKVVVKFLFVNSPENILGFRVGEGVPEVVVTLLISVVVKRSLDFEEAKLSVGLLKGGLKVVNLGYTREGRSLLSFEVEVLLDISTLTLDES